jgi:hypothetical protein
MRLGGKLRIGREESVFLHRRLDVGLIVSHGPILT